MKVVCAKVEDELGKTENKVEYLTELQNFIAGTPPPLEEIDPKKEAKQENEIGVRSAVQTVPGIDGVVQEENGAGFRKT